MTQEEKKRLENNLRKSASRAKTGYVRIKTGTLAEDQAFAPIGTLPVFDPITHEESSLDKVLSHLDNFKEVNKEIKTLYNIIKDLKEENNKQDKEIEELKARISSIELFNLD